MVSTTEEHETGNEPAVLAVDVGGSHVKILTSDRIEPRRLQSGPTLAPAEMIAGVLKAAEGWDYDVVSVGVPAPVKRDSVVREPANLGGGWVGFDFEAAFGKPTRVVNDAAMQALGSFEGGDMLFLGLGTGLGSALVFDAVVVPLELAHLPFGGRTYEHHLGESGRRRLGPKRWEKRLAEAVEQLTLAVEADYVVLGGGNAKRLTQLPPGARLGSNSNAFAGGFRLWQPSSAARVTGSDGA